MLKNLISILALIIPILTTIVPFSYGQEYIPSLELRLGYDDNKTLAPTDKEGGFIIEGYLGLEYKHKATPTSGSIKYQLGWLSNQSIGASETGGVDFADEPSLNHLLKAKLKHQFTSDLAGVLRLQGEYNNSDQESLIYSKYLVGGEIEYNLGPTTFIGLEGNYFLRTYSKLMPKQEDTPVTYNVNLSHLLTNGFFGSLGYQYRNNSSTNQNYEYKSQGPILTLLTPISDQIELQLFDFYETRKYEIGTEDKTLILSPRLVFKIEEKQSVALEYSYQKNDSSDSTKEFTQQRFMVVFMVSF
ncbi:MAG: hypothetical protein V1709_06825 [Planctomycetota bacterium]